jgi:hypothetical protein
MQLSDWVGRILFPQQDRWERRRNVKHLFIALGVVFLGLLLGLMWVQKELRQDQLNPEPQLNFQSSLP